MTEPTQVHFTPVPVGSVGLLEEVRTSCGLPLLDALGGDPILVVTRPEDAAKVTCPGCRDAVRAAAERLEAAVRAIAPSSIEFGGRTYAVTFSEHWRVRHDLAASDASSEVEVHEKIAARGWSYDDVEVWVTYELVGRTERVPVELTDPRYDTDEWEKK